MLRLLDITKSFGGLKAVDNVNIEFKPGKVISLIGPNGAGKTTIFNLISGFLKPDSGEILLKIEGRKEEYKLHKLKPYEIARVGIGRLFQDVRVFRRMKCIDNILLGRNRIFGENPLDGILFPHKVKYYQRTLMEQAEWIIDFVELKEKKDNFAEDLSYGQQKLLALARLLFGEYKILLLDEPTAGVNPAMIDKILGIIVECAKKMNKMVIVIEHNMNVVYRISDWVYFINEGTITAFGLPDDVLGNKEVKRIYIGL
ncbi:MAG: ABC transporter ATP-binding protein [bacterium]